MKLTLSWLKDYLETDATLDGIVDRLTHIGLEVEDVEDKGKLLEPFTIAYVLDVKQHPNADRLHVCMVDTGSGDPVQVVCGAPNARTGMKAVFSPAGTYIPGKKITLGVGVIRGVESRGMLCSGMELEISDDHTGIIELPDDAPVGKSFAEWAGLNDPVIDINLTPNRPDCTSIYGIARDLAAAGLGRLKPLHIKSIAGEGKPPVNVTLEFAPEDARLCPAFALRLVSGVNNGPSPDWMQRRLKAIGLRPINLLVDITNYLTYDQGRPLHVFDLKKVKGALVVRRARDGEKLLALDGREYVFDHDAVVIADDNGIESIGGIMGGENSGCDETTTDVLIESALWDPINIAQTGRRTGIITDARYRFERGVDPAFCVPGLDMATRMVMEFGGGEPSEIIVAGKVPSVKKDIDYPWSEAKRLTGVDVPKDRASAILLGLGFKIEDHRDTAVIHVPTWRPDIEGKADIVEEIIRIVGINKVESKPWPRLDAGVPKPILTLLQRRTRLAKRSLAARGLMEAVTYSFISKNDALLFGGGATALELANPIAADMSDMRPSLLPGLLRAVEHNVVHGQPDVALFEVGQCFTGDEPEDQTIRAAGVRRRLAGARSFGRDWRNGSEPVDAFDAKADVFALMTELNVPVGGVQVVPGGPDWLHPGRSATLRFGPKTVIGWFGELHPAVLKKMDIKGPLVAFELTLDALPPPKVKPTKVKAKLTIPEFHPVVRDFAFVLGKAVAAADLVRAVRAADRQLITGVEVFDLYEGGHVGPEEKSVAVAVTLQPVERTLTDADIEALSQKIVAEVHEKTGATLRA
ncbi:MAG: phenylalanine--tRNA ligase subunit beta [Methylobacteriaceae bacterium]|jgi:phenylalanyl-tRNA synthetase beta chain|nr:phenylalanine--tRNA ligase subunit beta [Methylobacteriaceae bacterium]